MFDNFAHVNSFYPCCFGVLSYLHVVYAHLEVDGSSDFVQTISREKRWTIPDIIAITENHRRIS